MEVRLRLLRRKQLGMILVNLAYFIAILTVGALVFLRGTGHAYLLVLACVAAYLLIVRPVVGRYRQALRTEILAATLGRRLTDYCYHPESGVDRKCLEASGLVPAPLPALHSREHILGKTDGLEIELADVAFPVRVQNRNEMFSGCYIGLTCPGAGLPACRVEAGTLKEGAVSERQRELVEKLGALVPGSLYLRMEGERMDLLLRGRFLGFRINPLTAATERNLTTNPLPELDDAIQLAKLEQG
ncbi:MAG: hypothetical protein AAGU02_03850 [Lawsonibacter sp.]